ncbi:MAG: hypothetical protein IJU76_05895 [Desulfovibrionaceae bacterium]|nr:hypothetical protein [Desulfovibrionaceae bacterium]
MKPINLTECMDDFTRIVNTEPVQDAAERLVRQAGIAGPVVAIEAFARLLVIETTRRRYAESRLSK